MRSYSDNAIKPKDCQEAVDEIKRLRAALKPFAEVAKDWGSEFDDDTIIDGQIDLGDCRKARRVLDGEKK